MINAYPGRCSVCNTWVEVNQGYARTPAFVDRHRGKFTLVCFIDAAPEEQAALRHFAEQRANRERSKTNQAAGAARQGAA